MDDVERQLRLNIVAVLLRLGQRDLGAYAGQVLSQGTGFFQFAQCLIGVQETPAGDQQVHQAGRQPVLSGTRAQSLQEPVDGPVGVALGIGQLTFQPQERRPFALAARELREDEPGVGQARPVAL